MLLYSPIEFQQVPVKVRGLRIVFSFERRQHRFKQGARISDGTVVITSFQPLF